MKPFKIKLLFFLKKKMIYLPHSYPHKKILMHKAKFSLIDKNEIFSLKDKITYLGDVLKKCEFDKTRLEAIFSKKHTLKKHTHTSK